ncbi:hypothetical protein [Sporosarcina sp. ITBMC105]
MKKLGFVLIGVCSLLLFACNANQSHQTDDGDRKEKNDEAELEKTEPVIELPKTDEEWLAFYQESNMSGLEMIKDAEYEQPLLVDFKGDGIPEVVLLYEVKGQGNSHVDTFFGFIIGHFDIEKREWSVEQQVDVTADNLVKLEAVGKLLFDDSQEALAVKKLIPGAGRVWYKIDLYRLSSEDNKVIRTASHFADGDTEISIDNASNSLRFSDQGKAYAFRPSGRNWLVSDTKRLYMYNTSDLYKEPFMELIGNNAITSYPVKIAENYEEAKARYQDSITLEDYYLGGICAQIEDFFFCSNDSTDEIVAIVISPSIKKNIRDYEKVLGFPDDGGIMEMDGPYYVWTYHLGDLTITLATDTENPESNIVEMSINQSNDFDEAEGF